MNYLDIKGNLNPPNKSASRYAFQGDPGELSPFLRSSAPPVQTTVPSAPVSTPTIARVTPTAQPSPQFFTTAQTQTVPAARPLSASRGYQEHVLEVPRDPQTLDRAWAVSQRTRKPTVRQIIWDLFIRVLETAIATIAQEVSLFFYHRRFGQPT